MPSKRTEEFKQHYPTPDEVADADDSGNRRGEIKDAFYKHIREEVVQRASEIENGSMTLAARNPNRAAFILMRYAMGASVTKIETKYGVARKTIMRLITDYADLIEGGWKKMGGKIASITLLEYNDLEDKMIADLHRRLDAGEYDVTPKDLKELSIAKGQAYREALTARGEATSISENRQVISQDDYEETRRRVQERLKMKKAEEAE